MRGLLAAAALALAAFASAETVEMSAGPKVALDGLYAPMTGPAAVLTLQFPRAGWVSSLAVDVRDEKGGTARGRGIICHAYLRDDAASIGEELPGLNARRTPFSLGTDEGDSAMALPPGFGLAVDTSTAYRFETRLQNADRANEGLYDVRFRFEFTPASSTAPPRALESFRVALTPEGGRTQWDLPPGKRAVESDFGLPGDYDAHVLNFHLHKHTVAVELVEKESGRVLYRGEARQRPDGFSERPSYSSPVPISLSRGKRYLLRAHFDNRSKKASPTMVVMWLYGARRGP